MHLLSYLCPWFVRVKVAKNKLAPPFRHAEIDLLFGKGISRLSEIVDLGLKHKIIVKQGSWMSYGNVQLGQGKEKSIVGNWRAFDARQ